MIEKLIKFIKDFQILIGLVIIAIVIYQSSESELDRCIDLEREKSPLLTEHTAITICMSRMNPPN